MEEYWSEIKSDVVDIPLWLVKQWTISKEQGKPAEEWPIDDGASWITNFMWMAVFDPSIKKGLVEKNNGDLRTSIAILVDRTTWGEYMEFNKTCNCKENHPGHLEGDLISVG